MNTFEDMAIRNEERINASEKALAEALKNFDSTAAAISAEFLRGAEAGRREIAVFAETGRREMANLAQSSRNELAIEAKSIRHEIVNSSKIVRRDLALLILGLTVIVGLGPKAMTLIPLFLK